MLSPEQIHFFRHNGFLKLPTRLPDARVEEMRTRTLVEDLMGRKPEKRYAFIQENAKFARDLDV